jgi:alkaline phosphatase D
MWRVTSRPRLRADPFTLGVASGDPLPDRCVIWTRLAPAPFEPQGGMNGQRTRVGWEVAHDEGFSQVVRRGQYIAAPELGFSVHVDVEGLEPNREYFYRFLVSEGNSSTGRLRTAPPEGADTLLRLGVASCQHYEQGLFTAFDHLAAEEVDVIAHLGDYIYEYAAQDRVRAHRGFEIVSVDDYRSRYALYKLDPALQAAHARCPWIVTWDDHEFDNNYAGLVGENVFESEEQMRLRRAAAYQAWWEHQPVRVPRARSWADLDIRREFAWGSLAHLWVLDTRQYRSDQSFGDQRKSVPCGDWANPSRTMLGDSQERWLLDGMAASDLRWQVLAQQVMVAGFDQEPGDEVVTAMDQWGGYPVARDRLLNAIGERAPGRSVVLTGDIHSSWVNQLPAGFDRPDQPLVAAEFVGTSISSGGDGSEEWPRIAAVRDENPQMLWQNNRRGYMRCTISADSWQTDYRTVPFVSRPGAPVETASSWTVAHGRAGIQRI